MSRAASCSLGAAAHDKRRVLLRANYPRSQEKRFKASCVGPVTTIKK